MEETAAGVRYGPEDEIRAHGFSVAHRAVGSCRSPSTFPEGRTDHAWNRHRHRRSRRHGESGPRSRRIGPSGNCESGTNVLIIVPGATTVSGVRGGLGSISTLTVDDAGDIEKKVSGVSSVLYATRSALQVIRENKNWSTIVVGTTPEFPEIRSWPVAQGNFFTSSDMDSAAKVAVLGKTAAQNLFEAGEELVGSEIRIRNVPLRVIGVLEPKGQSVTGQDQDDLVILPFSTAERKVLGTKFLGTVGIIMGATHTRHEIPTVVEDIKDLLRTGIVFMHLKKMILRFVQWRTSRKRSPARAGR